MVLVLCSQRWCCAASRAARGQVNAQAGAGARRAGRRAEPPRQRQAVLPAAAAPHPGNRSPGSPKPGGLRAIHTLLRVPNRTNCSRRGGRRVSTPACWPRRSAKGGVEAAQAAPATHARAGPARGGPKAASDTPLAACRLATCSSTAPHPPVSTAPLPAGWPHRPLRKSLLAPDHAPCRPRLTSSSTSRSGMPGGRLPACRGQGEGVRPRLRLSPALASSQSASWQDSQQRRLGCGAHPGIFWPSRPPTSG